MSNSNIQHKDIAPGFRHGIVEWEYPTVTALNAAVGFTLTDRHKIAYVSSPSPKYYALSEVSPITWTPLN
jgi:hypothetical protein